MTTAAPGVAGSVEPRSEKQRFRSVLLVLVLAGLAIRVLWVLATAHPPAGISDPTFYLHAGNSIADGDGYRAPTGNLTAFYPPGYPYFLGFVIGSARLLGMAESLPLVIGLVQALLGATTIGAVGLAGRAVGGGRLGLAAAAVVAFWPNLVVYTSAILSETLFLALFSVFTWLLLVALPAGVSAELRPGPLVGAAAALGAASLVRPQAALFVIPAVAAAWMLGRMPWRRLVAAIMALSLGVALAVAPWTLRNARLFSDFVPFSTNTGLNLCIGFSSSAWGGFTFACPVDATEPAAERRSDRELTAQALREIAAEPGRIPALTWTKLRITYSYEDDGVRGLESYGDTPVLGERSRSLVLLGATVYYWAVMLLAAAGLIITALACRQGARLRLRRATVIGLVLTLGVLPIALSFGDPRFKVPVYPLLAILAGTAVMAVADRAAGSAARGEDQDV